MKKSTDFNTTAMLKKYGMGYGINNIYDELGCYGDCVCIGLFPSNRQKGVVTVTDYFERNIASDKNPTGTKFQYIPKDEFYADYISPPYNGEMLQ